MQGGNLIPTLGVSHNLAALGTFIYSRTSPEARSQSPADSGTLKIKQPPENCTVSALPEQSHCPVQLQPASFLPEVSVPAGPEPVSAGGFGGGRSAACLRWRVRGAASAISAEGPEEPLQPSVIDEGSEDSLQHLVAADGSETNLPPPASPAVPSSGASTPSPAAPPPAAATLPSGYAAATPRLVPPRLVQLTSASHFPGL